MLCLFGKQGNGLRRHPNLLRFPNGKICLCCLHPAQQRAVPPSARISENRHSHLNLCYTHGLFLANMEDAAGIAIFFKAPSTSGATQIAS